MSDRKGRHPSHGRNERPKVLNSGDLFDVANELIIDHKGQHYRLRITSLGKLILTK